MKSVPLSVDNVEEFAAKFAKHLKYSDNALIEVSDRELKACSVIQVHATSE